MERGTQVRGWVCRVAWRWLGCSAERVPQRSAGLEFTSAKGILGQVHLSRPARQALEGLRTVLGGEVGGEGALQWTGQQLGFRGAVPLWMEKGPLQPRGQGEASHPGQPPFCMGGVRTVKASCLEGRTSALLTDCPSPELGEGAGGPGQVWVLTLRASLSPSTRSFSYPLS